MDRRQSFRIPRIVGINDTQAYVAYHPKWGRWFRVLEAQADAETQTTQNNEFTDYKGSLSPVSTPLL